VSAALPEPFPRLASVQTDDVNPAIRLFGKRFIADQTDVELLAEFLAVVQCAKRLDGRPIAQPLPAPELLAAWPDDEALSYRLPVRLNLKLLALLGVSRVDTRHDVHVRQHAALVQRLAGRIASGDLPQVEVVTWLEELLQGFQGAGFNRAWCAQSFLPLSPALLSQETIWNDTFARKNPISDWYECVGQFRQYFAVSRHRFLARGGELLYLQLCNALGTAPAAITDLVTVLRQADPASVSAAEADPRQLHASLQAVLNGLTQSSAPAFERLVETIENLDPETQRLLSRRGDADQGWLACEWCPRDSWREGYLLAIELNRVLRASLGPVQRLDMLMAGCALQVLRSLCAQSVRYADNMPKAANPLGYAWVFTPVESADRRARRASQRSVQQVQVLIQQALRHPALVENASRSVKAPAESLYREADSKYGHKLFLSIGKRLGLIIPKRGPGARFVMTDMLLRYLVLALLAPGERCTYESFLARMHAHYGIAVEGAPLELAAAWTGMGAAKSAPASDGAWLPEMLRASGFLTDLSDACAVVRNTYAPLMAEGEDA